MKNKKLIVLALSSMILCSCGSTQADLPDVSPSVSEVSSSVEVSVSEEPEVSISEEEQKEAVEYIPDITQIPEEELSTSAIYGTDMEIKYTDAGHCYILDGDKTVYFYFKYPDPVDIVKKDFDNDGIDEYQIQMLTGHGTGFYQDSIIVVKEGFYEPMAEISGSKLSVELADSLYFKWEDSMKLLCLYDYDGETVASLNMKQFLEDNDTNFVEAVLGDIVYVFDGGDSFWVEAQVGIYLDGCSWSLYDYTMFLTFPAYISESYEVTYGEIASKTCDYSKTYGTKAMEVGEVLFETYADITHDGTDDKILVFVPAEFEEDFENGAAPACMQIFMGFDGEKFDEYPILTREFAVSHVGNGQMFLTTINGYDYLVETSFWAGQGFSTYSYNVFFEDYNYRFIPDSNFAEFEYDAQPKAPEEFWTGLDKWLNKDSVLLYAADIDAENALLYSTNDNVISSETYLSQKR